MSGAVGSVHRPQDRPHDAAGVGRLHHRSYEGDPGDSRGGQAAHVGRSHVTDGDEGQP